MAPVASSVVASACAGKDPKANVYNPARLVLINPCKTVTGEVATVRREADGDYHVGLRLDAGQESLINATNVSGQGGNLVLEIVCANPVTQTDAVSACATYTNSVAAPPLGTHISATGPFVLDQDHGWNEIHPVWEIVVLSVGAVPTSTATSAPAVTAAPTFAVAPTPVPTLAPPPPPTPAPTVAVNLCGAPTNPWNYTFCGGALITAPPASFCNYFNCIASFWNGLGYVIECQDLTFSKSGGRSGSCSQHGGNLRPLYAP